MLHYPLPPYIHTHYISPPIHPHCIPPPIHPHCIPPPTHPLRADKGVYFWYSNDVGHECAQPLWVQEVQLTQLALQVIIVKEDSTLVEEIDSLGGGGGGKKRKEERGRWKEMSRGR